MSIPLEEEFGYYLANQDRLLALHRGQFIVIKNQCILGSYDSEAEAVRVTCAQHELGTFLVQKCVPGNSGYVRMYHSRVAPCR